MNISRKSYLFTFYCARFGLNSDELLPAAVTAVIAPHHLGSHFPAAAVIISRLNVGVAARPAIALVIAVTRTPHAVAVTAAVSAGQADAASRQNQSADQAEQDNFGLRGHRMFSLMINPRGLRLI